MRFDVVTLFPDMISSALKYGVTGKALESRLIDLRVWNPRDYTSDKHRTVDDRPYGGGPGMVLKYEPLYAAVTAAKTDYSGNAKVVYLTPQGQPISQSLLSNQVDLDQLILVAGRYEGVDERFVTLVCDEEWSIGDYVISGGELASLIIIDAITRLIPGVLGDADSAKQDSYVNGLLDYPHFTRPELIDGLRVPSVLLSGNHADINRWRLQQALGRTWQRRPDLLQHLSLSAQQMDLLDEYCNQINNELN